MHERQDEQMHSQFRSLVAFRNSLIAPEIPVKPAEPESTTEDHGSAVDQILEEKNETMAERLERLQRELALKDEDLQACRAELSSKNAELARLLSPGYSLRKSQELAGSADFVRAPRLAPFSRSPPAMIEFSGRASPETAGLARGRSPSPS